MTDRAYLITGLLLGLAAVALASGLRVHDRTSRVIAAIEADKR